ncbi:MAG: NAD(P)H-quinone oxidoreductase [Alphaproteobacteria bacterium 64-11]|nr:NAD(P)H-quinone oxidoreductase [Alphaproteobacteria bacterium]OJU09606.1 MAG: NAD(P)H-quinone oxidoreductase [Alphaproteobacteria bacterium 64-11]
MPAIKVLRIENPGRDYRLTIKEEACPHPGPGQVAIKVAAAGLNRADLLQGRGLYPPPPGASDIPGMEVSGTIIALGEGVEHLAAGQRVCALLAGGGYAEVAIADAGAVLPVPEGVDLVDAAGLPEACFTAWTNVIDTGRLAGGETLLVHGGTSGIGTIAIQMFAALGHRVFATAGSDEKCAACVNLGAARAINYRSEDFVAAVKDATGGAGVDVILDMVGGSYIQRNIAACAQWGRIVNIAYQDGARVEVDFAPVLAKKLTLAATTLRGRCPDQKRLIRNALAEIVWPLLETGRIHPVINRRFGLADANAAHAAMAKGGHVGKILLEL